MLVVNNSNLLLLLFTRSESFLNENIKCNFSGKYEKCCYYKIKLHYNCNSNTDYIKQNITE